MSNSPTNQPDRDSELAQLAREFPGWEIWKGLSGGYYGRERGTPESIHGETPEELGDRVRVALRLDGQIAEQARALTGAREFIRAGIRAGRISEVHGQMMIDVAEQFHDGEVKRLRERK